MASHPANDSFTAYGRSAGNATVEPDPINFVDLMPKVAARLWGEPNKGMSGKEQLRFGSHGSKSVDLAKGTFYDHEAKCGGGVFEAIQQANGCDMAGALSWLEDEGLKERTAKPEPQERTQVLSIFYDYRDETGAVISRVKRGRDKRFIQLGPDGRGGFHSATGCMQGVRRVPYRLPELMAAAPSRTVFICEGEKDADRLHGLGLVATCNSEGAGKFRPELAPFFTGRRCVALEDNDPAGREHVGKVVAALTGVVEVVTILRLPDLLEKEDVSDWLDRRGGTVERLKELARQALDQPVTTPPLDAVKAPALVSATPYVWCQPEAIKPREWVYGRSIQRGHVRAVVAQGGAGKTILSVGEALAMVTGRDLLGQPVPGGPKRVWLWNLEDPMEEMSRIIQAACKHWNITAADLDGRLFVDSALDGAPLKLATSTAAEGLVINRPLVDALTTEMIARGIDYLHVDPFVSSHAANESDNMEIDTIAKEWALVAKDANAGIGLAHHVSKAGAAEATALSARGAVALINACRSVLVLNRMGEDEARRFGIDEERRRRYFRTYDDKNNRAPPSDKSDWFQMFSISLGNGADDEPGDSIGVVVPWSPPDAFDGVTADHLYRVQQAVDARDWKENSQAKDWVGYAIAGVMGLSADKDAKADRARICALLRTWISTGALVVVEKRDPVKREEKKFVEVGEWALQGVAPPREGGAGKVGHQKRPAPPLLP